MQRGPRAAGSKSQAPATRSMSPGRRRLQLLSKKLHRTLGRRTWNSSITSSHINIVRLSTQRRNQMAVPKSDANENEISRDRLAELLNEDLSREYQPIIPYLFYPQVLTVSHSIT